MSAFAELKRLSDRLGPIYGTEDFGPFLYSLVRMQRPATILELGTGVGVAALWLGQAVAENGAGHVWTVDDGRHWPRLLADHRDVLEESERCERHADFFAGLLSRFGLAERVTLLEQAMPPLPELEAPIDLLFADYAHDPKAIIQLLAFYLPRLNECASVFIDSASTFYPSYAYLEQLVPILNSGRLPASVLATVAEAERERVQDYVRRSRFQLVHLTERKNREQNSTAWLRIEPIDTQPYPRTVFHT